MKLIKHPNVVQLYEVTNTPFTSYFCFFLFNLIISCDFAGDGKQDKDIYHLGVCYRRRTL